MDDAHENPARDHFARLFARWSDIGPPLQPSSGDLAVVERIINRSQAPLRAVVLGLTPQIIGLDWPAGTRLCAVDHSPAMLRELWPPAKGPPGAAAVLADWCAMPLDSGSVDLVAGDGCYIALSRTERFAAMTSEVHRVLRPEGLFVIRVFVRPESPESVADIGARMERGAIGSVHALKLLLHAALHGASGIGTRLDDVWRAWQSLPPPPAPLATRRGWTLAEVAGIEAYQGKDSRYYLPTLAEFRSMVSPLFQEVECSLADYELAERCPTFVFQSRK